MDPMVFAPLEHVQLDPLEHQMLKPGWRYMLEPREHLMCDLLERFRVLLMTIMGPMFL